ncbi:papain like protease [Maritimibacter alkaliphilus HTCC2654]|uniref:C1 family peptidase n=1 Tax=Maritimibacter alkaliphilus TaxID=404236 RepID=UPI0003229455|nr:papain like protease [Maritimibacter alkaliphilus HTCC2654]
MTVTIDVDLRAKFGPVRDQGARPTCLAFAASDAHAALRSGWDPLSCEFAFYHAQNRTGRSPYKGAFLDDMLAALRDTGQPSESGWPYIPRLPTDLRHYHPPSSVGSLFGRESQKTSHEVDRVCDALDSNVPAIVLSVLTRSFFNPPSDGVIDQITGDEVFPTPRHAVIAVGYGKAATKRVILVRNSWGPTWGLSGYAWLTEDFLAKHMYALAILTDECDVSGHSATA